jgi:hypothetical protein
MGNETQNREESRVGPPRHEALNELIIVQLLDWEWLVHGLLTPLLLPAV